MSALMAVCHVYLATQMTKGMVKITNILLQCDSCETHAYRSRHVNIMPGARWINQSFA